MKNRIFSPEAEATRLFSLDQYVPSRFENRSPVVPFKQRGSPISPRNSPKASSPKRRMPQEDFDSMLEVNSSSMSSSCMPSSLGQSLFELSLNLRPISDVRNQILYFRENAPLNLYMYKSVVDLLLTSVKCPPDMAFFILTTAVKMIKTGNPAPNKYLRYFIRVTKQLIDKQCFYISFRLDQEKPQRKLRKMLKIFEGNMLVEKNGKEGNLNTYQIEGILRKNHREKEAHKNNSENGNQNDNDNDNENENECTEVEISFDKESEITRSSTYKLETITDDDRSLQFDDDLVKVLDEEEKNSFSPINKKDHNEKEENVIYEGEKEDLPDNQKIRTLSNKKNNEALVKQQDETKKAKQTKNTKNKDPVKYVKNKPGNYANNGVLILNGNTKTKPSTNEKTDESYVGNEKGKTEDNNKDDPLNNEIEYSEEKENKLEEEIKSTKDSNNIIKEGIQIASVNKNKDKSVSRNGDKSINNKNMDKINDKTKDVSMNKNKGTSTENSDNATDNNKNKLLPNNIEKQIENKKVRTINSKKSKPANQTNQNKSANNNNIKSDSNKPHDGRYIIIENEKDEPEVNKKKSNDTTNSTISSISSKSSNSASSTNKSNGRPPNGDNRNGSVGIIASLSKNRRKPTDPSQNKPSNINLNTPTGNKNSSSLGVIRNMQIDEKSGNIINTSLGNNRNNSIEFPHKKPVNQLTVNLDDSDDSLDLSSNNKNNRNFNNYPQIPKIPINKNNIGNKSDDVKSRTSNTKNKKGSANRPNESVGSRTQKNVIRNKSVDNNDNDNDNDPTKNADQNNLGEDNNKNNNQKTEKQPKTNGKNIDTLIRKNRSNDKQLNSPKNKNNLSGKRSKSPVNNISGIISPSKKSNKTALQDYEDELTKTFENNFNKILEIRKKENAQSDNNPSKTSDDVSPNTSFSRISNYNPKLVVDDNDKSSPTIHDYDPKLSVDNNPFFVDYLDQDLNNDNNSNSNMRTPQKKQGKKLYEKNEVIFTPREYKSGYSGRNDRSKSADELALQKKKKVILHGDIRKVKSGIISFLTSGDDIYTRIEKGALKFQDLSENEIEKYMKLVAFFSSWDVAYFASKKVWDVMKEDENFEVNILLSKLPVSYGDFLVEALKTFAEASGIKSEIINPY